MDLAIGIIAYNESSAPYLPLFLPSLNKALASSGFTSYKLFVCDNSDITSTANKSAIDSFLLENKNFPLSYFSSEANLGFSKAYNLMIEKAVLDKAKYFLVINPDTILNENAIKEMKLALEEDSSLASVAPKIISWDFKNLQSSGKIDSLGISLLPGLKFVDLGQGESEAESLYEGRQVTILGPSGACGLFKLKALADVSEKREGKTQYFDERFFMYKEDCDLAYRLFLAGYSSKFVPSSIVYHDRTASSSGRGLISALRDRKLKSRQIRAWSFRNQHLIYCKFWSKQDFYSRFLIMRRVLYYFIFSLIFERFILKEYFSLSKLINKS